MRLAAVMVTALLVGLGAARLRAVEVAFEIPSDDRWHYPFNFTPGARSFASCFGSTSDPNYTTFNDRDGILLIAWPTLEVIPPGGTPAAYAVRAVQVTLTSPAGADWQVDLTPDLWSTMRYPPSDADPGQPLELFGVGFGPNYRSDNWFESSGYEGGDEIALAPRDPFPFIFQEGTAALRHVEDSVKDQFTPQPWSVGVPVGYAPGHQTVPFSVLFDVDLTMSSGRVRTYFQEQMSAGRVFVAVTSLKLTFLQAPSGFPTFYTKEGAGLHPQARAPRLVLDVIPSGDFDSDSRRALDDYRRLFDCLNGPGRPPAESSEITSQQCAVFFDLNEDGDVDGEDVSRWFARFTGGS